MTEEKILLLDADGVLILTNGFFSMHYAAKNNLDADKLWQFFKNSFPASTVGNADLKELINDNRDVWGLEGDVDELLSEWFLFEANKNTALITELVSILKNNNITTYLATNQEKYRGEYFKNHLFNYGLINGYFISNELGAAKPSDEYFKIVLEKLHKKHPHVPLSQIYFFDDSPSNIKVAREHGINAHLYENPRQLKEILLHSRTPAI